MARGKKAEQQPKAPKTKKKSSFRVKQDLRLIRDKKFIICRKDFRSVVNEIAGQVRDRSDSPKFTQEAIDAIQTAAEYFVSDLFVKAKDCKKRVEPRIRTMMLRHFLQASAEEPVLQRRR